MDKFAPMGSALCFPIECYVFASVVELAFRMHYDQASSGFLSGCSVYGDDIICPSSIYDRVVDILHSLGFKVNASKSFSSGGYYESCGVEYLYGALINAIKHPRSVLLCQQYVSPEQIGKISDLANTLLQSGYVDARRILLRMFSGTDTVIRNRSVPTSTLLAFDKDHLIPIQEPYRKTYWCDSHQTRYYDQWVVECRPRKSPSDFIQWKEDSYQYGPETSFLTYHEKWTPQGIATLERLGFTELLQQGDIVAAGITRTGRLHYRLRRLPKRL